MIFTITMCVCANSDCVFLNVCRELYEDLMVMCQIALVVIWALNVACVRAVSPQMVPARDTETKSTRIRKHLDEHPLHAKVLWDGLYAQSKWDVDAAIMSVIQYEEQIEQPLLDEIDHIRRERPAIHLYSGAGIGRWIDIMAVWDRAMTQGREQRRWLWREALRLHGNVLALQRVTEWRQAPSPHAAPPSMISQALARSGDESRNQCMPKQMSSVRLQQGAQSLKKVLLCRGSSSKVNTVGNPLREAARRSGATESMPQEVGNKEMRAKEAQEAKRRSVLVREVRNRWYWLRRRLQNMHDAANALERNSFPLVEAKAWGRVESVPHIRATLADPRGGFPVLDHEVWGWPQNGYAVGSGGHRLVR